MEICLSRWYFMVSYSVVCLSKIPYLCFSLGIYEYVIELSVRLNIFILL